MDRAKTRVLQTQQSRFLDTGFHLILLALFVSLFIQTNSFGEVLVLDWDSALNLALEKNEQIDQLRDEQVRARHQVGQAWSNALPSLSFEANYNHYFEIPPTIFKLPASMSPSGSPMNLKVEMSPENYVSGNLTLLQPLYVGGKVGIGLAIAKKYEKLSETNTKLGESDLEVELTQFFYGTILAEKYLEVAREMLDLNQSYLQQVTDLFDQGMVSEYDLIRAQVAVSNAQPDVIQAEASYKLAKKALKNLIGISVDQEIQIEGDLSELPAIENSYEEASEQALDNRLEFKLLGLQRDMYKYQFQLESRNVFWPTLFAGLRWETSASAEDTDYGKYQFLDGTSGFLTLSFNLFDGFSSRHKTEQVKVDIRNVDRQIAQLNRGVKVQVYQALSDFEKSTKEVAAAKEALALAEKGFSIANVRYRNGIGTQLEVLDATLMLNSSKVGLVNAFYNQRVASSAYKRALGI